MIISVIYPKTTSITCCQGLVELGFLINNFLFLEHDFTQSGISLLSDQSPPPITFPAQATLIKTLFFFFIKKDFMYELIRISADPLEAL